MLERVDALLDAFTPDGRSVSAAELARAVGLPRSSAHRLAMALEALGWLERDDGDRFTVGMRLFELAGRTPLRSRLREAAIPFMEDLYEATHATVHLGVLDGTDVVYVDKIGGHRRSPAPTRVGGRMPAHCTGLGKAMLAFADDAVVDRLLDAPLAARTPYTIVAGHVLRRQLGDIRTHGVAFDREEAALGVACAAAPVLVDGRCVAALSATTADDLATVDRLGTAVRASALGLARVLRRQAGQADRAGQARPSAATEMAQ